MELVVGASEATMRSVLTKIGGLLSDEYALIRGVDGDLQYINDELATMQSFLRAYDGSHGELMKDWMKQIRDITYDIEDCVDDSGTRIHGVRTGMPCYFLVNTFYEVFTWWPRRDIAAKISVLRMRAQQIGERRDRYGVVKPADSGHTQDPDGKAARFDVADNQAGDLLQLVATRNPVGVDGHLKKLDKRVTCIFGFGGVGKTAIATALYRNFGEGFSHRAVVNVSQSSDMETILRNIRDQVKPQTSDQDDQQQSGSGKNCPASAVESVKSAVMTAIRCGRRSTSKETREMHVLKEDIKKHLTGNRYLVLIDDVWSAATLDSIINSFPENESSRIIVTTRFRDVALTRRDAELRQVKGLDVEKSRELFMQAFRESQGSKDVITLPQSPVTHSRSRKESSKQAVSEPEGSKDANTLPQSPVTSSKSKEESSKQAVSEPEGTKDAFTLPKSPVTNSKSREESSKQAVSEPEDTKDAITLPKSPVTNSKSREESSKQAVSEPEGSKDIPFPEQVWKMCKGMPLAIVTMAGHVACSPLKTRDDWLKLCSSRFPELGKDDVTELTQEAVGKIISHCYNDMPAEIQTCSLYLSIFPKGCRISRKRLTRRWIAENIVCEKEGLSVEDVAETYFNHLIRRKIIQPVEHNNNGKVKKCIVHDMVLELIVAKASEENFITVVGGSWMMQPPSSKVRRLSLQGNDSKRAKETHKMNLSHVRSLTMFGSLNNQLPSDSLKFGIVQMLDLEGCKDFKQHHISQICEMLLLKYLSLRKTDTKRLPNDIGNLRNIETLDIRETKIVELPNSVCQLERLVNILGGDKTTREALRLPEDMKKKKKMKALRILSGIEITEGSSDLRHLTQLRKLAIYKLKTMERDESLEKLRSSIEYLGGYSLHTLTIDDETSNFIKSLDGLSSPPKFLGALELSGKMMKLPNWIKQLNILNKLTLSITAFRTDNLKDLSKLDALFSLTFSYRAKQQDRQALAIVAKNKLHSHGEITVPDGGFKGLKLFCLASTILPLMRFSRYAMPQLERLELRYSMLEGVFGAENLGKLKELHLTSDDIDNADRMTKEISSELTALKRIDGMVPTVVLHQRPLQ